MALLPFLGIIIRKEGQRAYAPEKSTRMFTGLVEGIGKIEAIQPQADGLRLRLTAPFPVSELQLGDSVAVSGPCLTVVAIDPPAFTVEVSGETLRRTNLGEKRPGTTVNLERALRLGDRLGGHLVSGHIDCVGTLLHKTVGPNHMQLVIRLPQGWSRYVVEKGSIAVDGVSLTVNSCRGNEFSVNIIPYTARHTTLIGVQPGDRLNIETDIIAKYIEKLLLHRRQETEGLSADFLARHGFLVE